MFVAGWGRERTHVTSAHAGQSPPNASASFFKRQEAESEMAGEVGWRGCEEKPRPAEPDLSVRTRACTAGPGGKE